MKRTYARAAGALIVLGTVAGLAGCSRGEAPAPPARPVLFEHPQPLAGESGEVFPGSVRAREEADLAFRVPGKIVSRKVDAGSMVKAGEVLASLDPEDARLNTASAEASLKAAEADARLAEDDLKRNKEMLDKGFISKSLYDAQENRLKLAQARAEQAASGLAVIRNQAGYTRLVADKPGVITAVLAEAGQVVAAGQPVFRFASESGREVVFNVPEGRVDALRKAPKLLVTLWAQPDKMYAARIREITPQADPSTRTHQARVTIVDADAAVQLGMTATVIMGAKLDGQLFSVPLSALGSAGDKPQLWIIDAQNRIQPLPVTVHRYVDQAAIVSGALDAQTRVVSAGVQLMVAGQPVTALARDRKRGADGSAP